MINDSFTDTCKDLLCITQGVNDSTNGLFFSLLLFIVWIFVLVSYIARGRPMENAMLGTSFLISLIAGAAMGLGLVDPYVLIFPAIALFISILLKISNR